ncbi:MAG: response regulator transcription factor [Bacteroidetes bacterium]|nr:response regulator transcription factor [Fibrella sp.]
MPTILLVENDPVPAMDLALRLTQMGFRVLSAVDTGGKALEIYQKYSIDLILLNISISSTDDGIDIAEQLQQIKRKPFIFLTPPTNDAVIERARQTGPAAYIAKPFNDITLRMAIDLALQGAPGQATDQRSTLSVDPSPDTLAESGQTLLYVNDAVFIKQNYRFVKFYMSDVLYMQSEGNYTDIITTAKKYTIRLVLNKVLEKLQSPDIIRNHRSYAVNLRHIQSFSEQGISIGSCMVPVGRSYREAFVKRFALL